VPGFRLDFSPSATAALSSMVADAGLERQLRAVRKALGQLEVDTRHQALKTHKYKGKACPHGGELFEAYAQNKTPGAWRIFFCYPPEKPGTIYVVDITPHP
jgi:hypothetical protein